MPTVGQTTLGAIRTQAQQRCDMVNSNFISTAEWNSMINLSYYELYDLLAQKYGNDYFMQTPYQFSSDGINNTFTLPVDFYKLLGVDLSVSGGAPNSFITLKPFNFAERNRYAAPNIPSASMYGYVNMRYRLMGNTIWFSPLPAGGQVFQVYYVPRLTALVNDTDVVDGVSGWEEYIIIDAAIKATQKEEGDCTVLGMQKEAIIARIEAAAENRDAGMPSTVSDATNGSAGFGYGDGWGCF